MSRLQSLTNIQTANSMLRVIIISTFAAAALIVGFTFYKSQQTINEIRKSVYIPINGKSMEMMTSQNMKDNRVVEIKNHLKMFHELFFNITPDEAQIKENVGRSLYLIDESGKLEHESRQEQKFYSNLITSNGYQYIHIDSILVDQYSNPYKAQIMFTRTFVRPTVKLMSRMTYACDLINMPPGRSENNPHALMIKNWTKIKEEVLERVVRGY
jgi:conjugative transposon TraK protein